MLDAVLAVQCRMVSQTLGLAKAVALFSLVLAPIALLFTPQGDALAQLPLWGYIGTESVAAAVLIVVRLVACAVPLFLVFYVTKLTDMANALVKVLHVPYKYVFTFMSTVHFIPVFMNDMAGIMDSGIARGVEFDGGFLKKIRLMMPLCVPLLVSSVRRRPTAPPSPPRCEASICAPGKAASRSTRSQASTSRRLPWRSRSRRPLSRLACCYSLDSRGRGNDFGISCSRLRVFRIREGPSVEIVAL